MNGKLTHYGKEQIKNHDLVQKVRHLFDNVYKITVWDDIQYNGYAEITEKVSNDLDYNVMGIDYNNIYIRV